MAVVNPCQKELDAFVDAANVDINNVLVDLAQKLAKYGFAGEVKIRLDVSIFGSLAQDKSEVARETRLPFRR